MDNLHAYRDVLVGGQTFAIIERDTNGRAIGIRRVDPRDVVPYLIIPSDGRPYVGTIALIAWAAYWIGIIWAVAAGRI